MANPLAAAPFAPKPEIMLASVADVDALLARSRYFFGAQGLGRVVLHFPYLPIRETEHTQARLNNSAHDCGCGIGAIAAAAGLMLYAGLLFTAGGPWRQWRPVYALWGLVVCVAFAMAGKIAGLVLARFRFIQELQRLKSRLGCGGY